MKKEINILVKKWFDKINGNTYHNVQFEFNNKLFFQGLTYGYGCQYEQTFEEIFKKAFPKRNIKLYKTNYRVIENCLKRDLNKVD